MKYIVIGAGPAGVVAAEALAKGDAEGHVTLIGNEGAPPYSRMAIPYVLTGKIGPEGTYLRKDADHYATSGIETVRGHVATVDTESGTVTLDDGHRLGYDKLLVATGSTPVSPPVPGLELEGVHHCWTLKDAEAIVGSAEAGADVVLMGAGFIGCIIMESLVARGVGLTVVEAEDRMIPKMMDETGGAILSEWVKGKGVKLLTSTKVTSVKKNGGKLVIALDRGGDVAADLLVVATGVKPNTDFLTGSGVRVEDGIVVDDRLKTSVDGVYAAGDVAKGPDFGGGFHVHAIQPTAAEHGRVAALNMMGKDAPYRGSLIMNVLDTMGLVSASFGRWRDGEDVVEKVDEARARYIKLTFDGERVVGALSIGRTEDIGVLRGLIQSRIKLGPWKRKLMADPSLIADAYVARTRA